MSWVNCKKWARRTGKKGDEKDDQQSGQKDGVQGGHNDGEKEEQAGQEKDEEGGEEKEEKEREQEKKKAEEGEKDDGGEKENLGEKKMGDEAGVTAAENESDDRPKKGEEGEKEVASGSPDRMEVDPVPDRASEMDRGAGSEVKKVHFLDRSATPMDQSMNGAEETTEEGHPEKKRKTHEPSSTLQIRPLPPTVLDWIISSLILVPVHNHLPLPPQRTPEDHFTTMLFSPNHLNDPALRFKLVGKIDR